MNKPAELKRRLLREITQEQIIDFDTHLRDLKTLKQQTKEKEQIVDALEAAYDKMLTAGYTQEAGELRLALRVSARQAAVKWKEKFAETQGPRAVEDAMRDAGMSEIRHVDVVSAAPTGKE